jgi:hypothetical protein
VHLDDINSLLVLVLCRQEVFSLHPPLLPLKQQRICHVLRAVRRSEIKKLSNVTFWSFTEHGLSEEMLELIPYEFCFKV